MEAILWAIAIPVIIVLGLVALWVGAIVLVVALAVVIPIALIGGGISVGGPGGGVLVLLGVIAGFIAVVAAKSMFEKSSYY